MTVADDTAADDDSAARSDALALAEQAEAEAEEAEALAAAARARATAIALRRSAAEAARADEADEPGDEEPGDEEPEGDPEDDTGGDTATAEDADASPGRSRLSTALAATTVALICGVLGLSGFIAWHHHTANQHREKVAAFAAAARQELINLTSFDFNHAREGVQRVLDNATGEFKDDFGKRADDFTSVVEKSKVVTEGKVNAVAVESVDGDSAVVLVAATSNVTNAAGAKEEPRTWRMRLSVSREGDQYKVSKVEMVP